MKKKFTIEEIAGVFEMTPEGVRSWTMLDTKRVNAFARAKVNPTEGLLTLDKYGKVTITEFLRWSEFCNSLWLCREIPRIDKRFIKILEEGDPEKIKKLVMLNNERLRILEERKQILKGD